MDLDGMSLKKQKGKKKKEVVKIGNDTSRIKNGKFGSLQKQQIINDRVFDVSEKIATPIIKITNNDEE